MRTETLLIELGTEELPPKSLKTLATAFASNVQKEIDEAQLAYSDVKWFASPRRIAVQFADLAYQQADTVVEKRGPAVSAAFTEDGQPTKAAMGWARGNGIDVADAQRLVTDKGEWLLHKAQVTGQALDVLIEGIVSRSVAKLPIPKPMRWGDSDTQFIRPVHTFTAMYGADVLPASVLDMPSNNVLQGHRFHGPRTFTLAHADNYEAACREHFVVANYAVRQADIAQGLNDQAQALGLTADYNEALLEEIASLVEYPVVLQASFEERFLAVPKEALIYTMKDDQKYVPLLDSEGNLSSTFLFVSNIQSSAPEHVIEGNQKVIRPRLADAEFFFNTDKKHSLASRLESLNSILFQKQLGTLAEKAKRIEQVAGFIAQSIGANADHAARAGLLAKTDLMTEMVMEFPDVQGVMGKYYALNDGEDSSVAQAIAEQYMPRQSGDALPSSDVSAAVALADKLDTLAGIFGIGMLPKGDKDPFALRRAAIGVLRIITERDYDLDVRELLAFAVATYGDKLTNADTLDNAVEFVLGRFRAMYQDQGIDTDVIQAVSARNVSKPADFAARVHAVAAFKALPQAQSLAAANKRVANILAKNEVPDSSSVDESLLNETQESNLYQQITQQQATVNSALVTNDYTTILTSLAQLQDAVDAFFDNIMVMSDDASLRQNRLALLLQLRTLFLSTADISVLANK
ncbi:MAG: glycine--tRNA ligase subunit beta [Glaciecola sp.]|jgi:glycyl-tRNA synthetase beta chain|nr:glycine--tRNA ligase subunit beta [Glaciecola sp.]MDG1815681.1 glycine--tRNA ligase subunit beta [Glaciecola sp.]MDG2098200.1 glycine--tRNA ligase subunit beta [Glaciecola sp.]